MKIMSNREVLYKKFIDLSPTNGESNEFTVDTIIEGRPHKIGVSPEGHVMIFVECSDEKVTSNIKLKMFNVTFNRLCKLNNHDNTVEKKEKCTEKVNILKTIIASLIMMIIISFLLRKMVL